MLSIVAFNQFPVAGAWMLALLSVFALLLLPVMPLIHKRRKKREQAELHERIEQARTEILKDGKITGHKGPYVRATPWGIRREVGTPRTGPPRANAYHGGPWPHYK
jgi:hypothetical protein